MKRGGPSHPKTQALAEALGVTRAHAVGLLECMFHFVSQYCPQGDIGRYSDKRISAGIGWHGKPSKAIDCLVTTGWVCTDKAVRLVVHDWHCHVDRYILARLSRQGKMPIQCCHEYSRKLCAQNDPDRNTLGAYTVPVPVPVPEPVPHSAQIPQELSQEIQDDWSKPDVLEQIATLITDFAEGTNTRSIVPDEAMCRRLAIAMIENDRDISDISQILIDIAKSGQKPKSSGWLIKSVEGKLSKPITVKALRAPPSWPSVDQNEESLREEYEKYIISVVDKRLEEIDKPTLELLLSSRRDYLLKSYKSANHWTRDQIETTCWRSIRHEFYMESSGKLKFEQWKVNRAVPP